jgi:hypothetical protein
MFATKQSYQDYITTTTTMEIMQYHIQDGRLCFASLPHAILGATLLH